MLPVKSASIILKSRRKCRLKLYIWTGFEPDWYDGLAFAIARSEKDARELVEDFYGDVEEWGKLEVRPLTRRVARSVSGGG